MSRLRSVLPGLLYLSSAAALSLLLASCCASQEQFLTIRGDDLNNELRARQAAIEAALTAHNVTLVEPLQKTTWSERMGGSDPLPERAVLPAARAPTGFEGPEGIAYFIAGPRDDRAGLDYVFGRTRDGKLLVIELKRHITVDKIRTCGCDHGRGVAEFMPPPEQVLYWFRIDRPEDVTFVASAYDAREPEEYQPSCGGPPAP